MSDREKFALVGVIFTGLALWAWALDEFIARVGGYL